MSQKKKIGDWNLIKRVMRLAIPYRRIFTLCTITAIILIPLNILRPYLIELIVDNNIRSNDHSGLSTMIMIFVGVIVLTVLFQYFFIYNTNYLGQSIVRDLRNKVFQKIVKFKLSYFDRTPIGQSTTRTISDVEAINKIFTDGLITIISESLMIIAVLSFLFYTSWVLGLICLILLPILILATYVFKEKIRVAFTKVRNELSDMNAFVQEHISGIKIVQIFNAEKQEYKKFKAINQRYTRANLDAVLYYAVFFPFVELIYALSLAVMVWLGTSNIISGYVTFGELVAFPIYLNMLYRPIRLLADRINTLQMGLVASERVFKILDKDFKIENSGTLDGEIKGNIQFEKVHFSYVDDVPVLQDISFEIEQGETLAIVGATGSGKSTIINLICRFYEKNKGNILVDDKPIEQFDLDSLRKNVGIILQDVFLFSGTVTDNISLRNEEVSFETIKKSAELIGAHEFIEKLPKQYDFQVSERGGSLSMGQRQLISFVRALVFDPRILILDEATSSIDPESESLIQYAIEKLITKRTSIIIAHRLSTIRHADKVIVLERGRIVEEGHPDDLLNQEDSHFRKLYEKQLESAGALRLSKKM